MTKALQLARSFHARRAPGDPGRVGASTGSPGTGSPAPSTAFHTVPDAAVPRLRRGAARHRAGRGRRRLRAGLQPGGELLRRAGRSRCWRRTARCVHCDADMIDAASTTSTRSPRSPPSLGPAGAGHAPDHRPGAGGGLRLRAPPSRPYILKSIAVRPGAPARPHPAAAAATRRGDGRLRRGPSRSPRRTRGSCRSSSRGQEYCTHGTVRDGRAAGVLRAASPRRSRSTTRWSTSPRSRRGCARFVGALGLTGQVSFDFIEAADGQVLRHRVQPAHALGDHDVLRPPRPGARPTSTTACAHVAPAAGEPADLLDLPRAVAAADRSRRRPRAAAGDRPGQGRDLRLATTRCRSCWCTTCRSRRCCWQPARARKDWIRIDFNIGKLVEPAGD